MGGVADLVARRLVARSITFRVWIADFIEKSWAAVGKALPRRVQRVLLLHGMAWLS